jgi:hypothetical protein
MTLEMVITQYSIDWSMMAAGAEQGFSVKFTSVRFDLMSGSDSAFLPPSSLSAFPLTDTATFYTPSRPGHAIASHPPSRLGFRPPAILQYCGITVRFVDYLVDATTLSLT